MRLYRDSLTDTMSTRGSIAVLQVDDDSAFAEMAADFLERENERFTVDVATSGSEAFDTLADKEIDCIVSDYQMPGWNGVEFLETTRKKHPDLPFILFTGKGSEDVASQAISAGATDYVQKQQGTSQYEVLANRIENNVARHRAEQDVVSTEHRYRRLIEETSDVIIIVDPDGTFQYLSPSAEDGIGYAPHELVGENGFEYIHPEDRDEAMTQFFAMVENQELRPTLEFRFEQKDGSTVWLEVEGRNLLEEPTIEGLVVYARNITDRKEREQRLERYRTLVESVGDPMYILDDAGYLEMVNQSMADLGESARNAMIGEHVGRFMTDGYAERGADLIRELLNDPERTAATYEVTAQPEVGDPFPAEVNLGLILDDDGEFLGTAGVVHDLTEYKST